VILERLELGSFASNCYLVADEDTKEAIVIDPGVAGGSILSRIKELGLAVKYIVITHGHPDHIGAVWELKEATGAKLLIHPEDARYLHARPGPDGMFHQTGAPPEVDMELNDGDTVNINNISLQVIHTPGHSPGGICLLTGGILFSGDTLFFSSIGRSDFPGGNGRQLLESIHNKLMTLPDDTTVLPGHGPETTIGTERKTNPFLNM